MIVMSLIFRSLPVTYMAQKPANVLDLTKLLEKYAERRIIETAQFVFDTMEYGWYNPDKWGIRTIQRVRLMHASMRHLIMHSAHHDPKDLAYPWQEGWGKPISQEDMLATLQTFSLEVIHVLERLGMKHSEALVRLNEVLAESVSITSDDLVLDAGCGQGGEAACGWRENWEREPSGYRHLGLTSGAR